MDTMTTVTEHYAITQWTVSATSWKIVHIPTGVTLMKDLSEAHATKGCHVYEQNHAAVTVKAEEIAAKAKAERVARKVREQAPATAAQVDYIMSLIGDRRHEEGGWMSGPTTREGVAGMSRREASGYIDSLTDRY